MKFYEVLEKRRTQKSGNLSQSDGLRNRQNRPCRRAPRGRRQAHAPAADRTHPPARPQRMDRGVPRLRPHRVRACGAAGDPSRRRAHPHGRGGRRRGTRLRPRRGDGHRRGAAADVRRPLLRVPPQPQRRHVGRSGNHGVRPPGRHRRQAGRSRPRGRPLRGRRRAANDHSGIGDDFPVARLREDRPAQQLLPGHGAPVAGTFLRPRWSTPISD